MKEIIARATDEEVEEFKKIQTEAKAAEELSQRLMEDLQAVIYKNTLDRHQRNRELWERAGEKYGFDPTQTWTLDIKTGEIFRFVDDQEENYE